MYKILVDGEKIGESDSLQFILLHRNGSYVICDQDESEGVCVKLPKILQCELENGSVAEITILVDCVFRLKPDGLKGFEPLAQIEELS